MAEALAEYIHSLVIIECGKDGLNNQRPLCLEKGIEGFPTWEINGTLDSGIKKLSELAELIGY